MEKHFYSRIGRRFALSLLAGAALTLSARAAQAQFGPVPVAVEQVVQRKVAEGQTFVGTVMPVRHSIVGSAVDGRVIEFYVNEGDFVKKDQPLAQLRTEALEIQVAAAKAEWDLRKQELAELENGSRPEEVQHAKAQALAAKAHLAYRQSRYKRMRELVERRASSPDETQDAASAAETALQLYHQAKATYDMAVQGPRKEKVLQAKARVLSALEEVHRLEDQLRKHTVVSPFDGFVIAEHTEIGQWISQAAPVAEVVELSEVDVHAWVLENYVPTLKVGMPVLVRISALPDQTFSGEVRRIVPQADTKSRSFPVKIRLENTITPDGPLLKPGMLAQATFSIGKQQTATLVPKDALVLGGPAPLVYVVDGARKVGQSGKVRAVPVQLGVVEANLIQVTGDIKPGDSVVVQGNERLRPGMEVTLVGDQTPIRQSASSPRGEKKG